MTHDTKFMTHDAKFEWWILAAIGLSLVVILVEATTGLPARYCSYC